MDSRKSHDPKAITDVIVIPVPTNDHSKTGTYLGDAMYFNDPEYAGMLIYKLIQLERLNREAFELVECYVQGLLTGVQTLSRKDIY